MNGSGDISRNASGIPMRHVCGALAVALCCAIALRWLYVVAGLAHLSAEPAWRTLRFFLLAGIVATGPGIFLLSRLRPVGRNPFLAPTLVIATSLGSTMLAAWLCYASGVFTKFAAAAIVAADAALLLAGLTRLIRASGKALSFRSIVERLAMSPAEAICLVASAMLALGMFAAVCGHPFAAWDAIVSYDKWAADIYARRWLGGYLAGGYPQGIPLLGALLYKLCLPPGADPVLSIESLLAPGLFQVFPLLACLALLSASRSLRLNPLFPLGIMFGNAAFTVGVVKYAGYVDVPLGAFSAAAIALSIAFGDEREEGASAGWRDTAALALVFFAIAFTKGNGLVALALAMAAAATPPRQKALRRLVPAMAAALLAAGTYYLWQWVTGVWFPSLAETSLFNHSLPVQSSHRDLITPNFAHFVNLMRVLCTCYGLKPGLPAAAAVALGIIAPLLPLIARRTRRAAIVVALLSAIWFFTGSYDMRNLLYLIPVFAILVPASIQGIFPRRAACAIALAASALLLYSVSQTRYFQIAGLPLRHYSPPEEARLDAMRRQTLGIGITEEQCAAMRASDVVRRAPCIAVMSPRYRYLFGKGVFTLPSRTHAIWPKSLALSHKFPQWRDDGFTPVAEYSAGKMKQSQLLMASPEYVDVPFVEVSRRDGVLEIEVDCRGLDFGNSGIARLRLAGEASPCKLEVVGQNAVCGGMISSTQDGDAVSTVFLLDAPADTLRLKVSPAAEIAGASIGW